MSTTRKAFLGAGAVAAAGAGLAGLPKVLSEAGRRKESLSLETRDLAGSGAAPAFGSLRPGASGESSLHGSLHTRGSRRRAAAGSVSIASVVVGNRTMRIHTFDFQHGSLVAIGDHRGGTVSAATGRYSGARGTVKVNNAARAAVHFDIELEL